MGCLLLKIQLRNQTSLYFLDYNKNIRCYILPPLQKKYSVHFEALKANKKLETSDTII